MIALFRDIRPDEPRGVLRTALADDGSAKRIMLEGVSSKLMLGSSKHAAIKLHPLAKTMGIAEGIETALTKRENYITRRTLIAPAEPGSPFPLFRSFLEQITAGDVQVERFLQQFGGYSLTGDTREQMLLFIWGPGGNGKGVLVKIFHRNSWRLCENRRNGDVHRIQAPAAPHGTRDAAWR